MKRIAAIVIIAFCGLFTAGAADLYVALSGNDTNSGSDWLNAKKSIQAAVSAAVSGDQVWITNGTYRLDAEITVTNAIFIRSVNGPEVTVVDGCRSNRCFNLSSACTVSGLTISNGFSNGHGGGIYCADNRPVVADCVIISNRAGNGTGGISALGEGGNGTAGGNGFDGGGMYRGTVSNCTFIGNQAGSGGSGGSAGDGGTGGNGGNGGNGGGYCGDNAYDCTFIRNSAGRGGFGGDAPSYHVGRGGSGGSGGGIFGNTATDCSFTDNHAGDGGYAGVMDPSTRYSTRGNGGGSGGAGGGMYGQKATNCTFTGNRSGNGGYGKTVSPGDYGAGSGGPGGGFYGTEASDCVFTGNQTGSGGGGTGSRRGGNGGGMAGSIANRCVFLDNRTGEGGAGSSSSYDGGDGNNGGNGGSGGGAYGAAATLCIFSNNWTGAGGNGGAGFQGGDGGDGGPGGGLADGSVTNCVFINNWTGSGGDSGSGGYLGSGGKGGDGGGVYSVTAVHCTIYGNKAGNGGYGYQFEEYGYFDNGTGGGMAGGTAKNCIAWGNIVQGITNDLSGVSASFTCAADGVTNGVNGCITNDPHLVQFPDGYWRLGYESPCINAGNNGYVTVPADLDGNVRIVGGTVDMGAYEYNAALYDSDKDQMTDDDELIAGTDPTDKTDVLRITAFRNNAAYFNSSAGRQYTLLFCTNLTDGVWYPVSEPYAGSGGSESIGTASISEHGFYKLQVKIP